MFFYYYQQLKKEKDILKPWSAYLCHIQGNTA